MAFQGRVHGKVARSISSICPHFPRSKAIAIDLSTFIAVRSFYAYDERVNFCESVGASGGANEGRIEFIRSGLVRSVALVAFKSKSRCRRSHCRANNSQSVQRLHATSLLYSSRPCVYIAKFAPCQLRRYNSPSIASTVLIKRGLYCMFI